MGLVRVRVRVRGNVCRCPCPWGCPRICAQCRRVCLSADVAPDLSRCVNFHVAVFQDASGSCGSREYPYAMRVLCASAAVRMGRVGSGVAVSACPSTSACVNKCLSKETDATGSLLELCCPLSRMSSQVVRFRR